MTEKPEHFDFHVSSKCINENKAQQICKLQQIGKKLQHFSTWVICLRVLISKIRNSFLNKMAQGPSTQGSIKTKNKKAKTKNSTKMQGIPKRQDLKQRQKNAK